MFYGASKEFENVHLDLSKPWLQILIKARKYLNNLFNVGSLYADITVASKFTFKITTNNFFDTVDELISKTGFPSDI